MSFGNLQVTQYWNASTNSPKLVSGKGRDGIGYLVSVAGSTNLDGISTWNVDDIVVFILDQWVRIAGPNSIGAGGGGGATPAGSDGDLQVKSGTSLAAISRSGGTTTDYLARDNTYKVIPAGGGGGGTTITGGGLGFNFDSRAAAIGATIAAVASGGPNWVRTNGYAAAGDGGHGLYVRVGSAPSYSSLIWFTSADGQRWGLTRKNEPLRLEQAGGGVSASGANNNAAANALMSMFGVADDQGGYAYPGPNIQIGYGVYNFASAWKVHGTCNIHGLGSGGDSGYGSTLKFPVNSDGLVFGFWLSDGRTLTSANWGQGAAGTVVRDLTIRGGWDTVTQPRTAANPTGPWGIGYLAKCTTVAINVNVQQFPEQGFYTIGTSGGGSFTQTDEPYIVTEGAPNSFSYYSCRAAQNGLDGFKDRGADANAGTYFECSGHDNGQWGFNILNFLGNSLYGCHTTTNAQKIATDPVTGKSVSHYQCAGESQSSTIIGCYGENDPHKNFFDQNCFVAGGLLANSNIGNATIIYQQGLITSPFKVLESSSHDTSGLSMTLQPGDINDAYMFWGMNDDRGSWWSYQGGNITQHAGAIAFNDHGWAFTGKNNGQQCGRGAAIANGNMIFPNGMFLAGRGTDGSSVQYGDARFVGTLPGLPTAGKWARGDRIHMRDPSAGGIHGYVCTTGGDYAGTPPVWKSMGNLAA